MLRPSTSLIRTFCLFVLAASALAQSDEALRRRRSPVVEVFEKCRNAVVNISTTRVQRTRMLDRGLFWNDVFDFGRPVITERRVQSVGSGVVIHEHGYIVTNAHVVEQTTDVHVTFADNRTLPARVISSDPEHDLAVIKVDADEPLPFIKLGRSDDLMVGETVVAIGNPHGLQHTVTAGIVSAVDRELQFNRDLTYHGLIQTDAAINAGNSGGSLINVNSELIGINSAILGTAQNVGFAIPVDQLWQLLPSMLDIEQRQRVRFGLEVNGPDAEVVAVHPDSPASRAGFLVGDRITYFRDHELRDGIDYYVNLLEQPPGSEVSLKYRRGRKTRKADIALQVVPPPDGRKLARSLLGMGLDKLDLRYRRRYDLPESVGVYVNEVTPRGPADRAGIIAGDIILRVNRMSVPDVDDVGLTLEDVQPGEHVYIHGLRVNADAPFVWTVALPTNQ